MTDREKAIEAIEEALKDAAAEAGGYSFHLVISPALKTALAALRAEEEREKGCEYCDPRNLDYTYAGNIPSFCKYCGRKLDGDGQDARKGDSGER